MKGCVAAPCSAALRSCSPLTSCLSTRKSKSWEPCPFLQGPLHLPAGCEPGLLARPGLSPPSIPWKPQAPGIAILQPSRDLGWVSWLCLQLHPLAPLQQRNLWRLPGPVALPQKVVEMLSPSCRAPTFLLAPLRDAEGRARTSPRLALSSPSLHACGQVDVGKSAFYPL